MKKKITLELPDTMFPPDCTINYNGQVYGILTVENTSERETYKIELKETKEETERKERVEMTKFLFTRAKKELGDNEDILNDYFKGLTQLSHYALMVRCEQAKKKKKRKN